MAVRSVLSILLVVLCALGSTVATEIPPLEKHVLLKRKEADLVKKEANLHAREETAAAVVPKLKARVLGACKPGKKSTVKTALGKYEAAKRMGWLADKNKAYAHKLVQRLTPRVPKMQASMTKLFRNYVKGELALRRLEQLKSKAWLAARMHTLTNEVAVKVEARIKNAAKAGKKIPIAQMNVLRARVAKMRSRAAKYQKAEDVIKAEAGDARKLVIDWCKIKQRARCNLAIRDLMVSRHRLWEAKANRAKAKKDSRRYNAVAAKFRTTVGQDTFINYAVGIKSFRQLRASWMKVWRLQRMRTIVSQMITRTKRRADRVWAGMNKKTFSKQEKARAAAIAKGETLPASGAEKVASEPIVYQTTVGKRQPTTRTRPEVQFAGPNMDPKAIAGAEIVEEAPATA